MQRLTTALGSRAGVSLDWERLYEAHASQLQRYLAKLLGEREAATELMQDTFVRAMRAEIRDAGAVRTFLFRTATNLALSRARRGRLLAFLPFSGREVAPGGAYDVEAAQVRRALGSIPADQAATLLLHYQSGFTRAEIAEMQGVGEEAVKSRLARGRKAFVAAYRRLQRGLAG